MSGASKVTCLDCNAVNRVPNDKLGAGPKCGTCGSKLIDGKVRAMDVAALQKAARTDQLPLLVDFWAPWCGPCKMMAPEFAKAAQVLAPNIRLAKIDTQDHPKVSQTYAIRGIPALILFQNGKEVARHAGAIRAEQIVEFVRSKVKTPA